MSRRLRYQVAVSLDGFIAGPNGEYDWIVMDPAIDFAALFKEFDTAVMGRKTYEVMTAQGGHGAMPGLDVVVFSRTLPAGHAPGVRIVNDDPGEIVTALKAKPGRDIWLFGGGALFRSLLDAGLVDTVELAVIPVLLGAGIPLLPPGATTKLKLCGSEDASGQRHRGALVLGAWRRWPGSPDSLHQGREGQAAKKVGKRTTAAKKKKVAPSKKRTGASQADPMVFTKRLREGIRRGRIKCSVQDLEEHPTSRWAAVTRWTRGHIVGGLDCADYRSLTSPTIWPVNQGSRASRTCWESPSTAAATTST